SKLWAVAEEVYAAVLELGGTISTQHGTGLARSPWVGQQYGRLYGVFRELKAIFDPRHLFNPGKIIGAEPAVPAGPRRRPPATDRETVAGQQFQEQKAETQDGPSASLSTCLLWPPDQVREECHRCNGCGHCRTEAPAQRMCPIFRATHAEEA